MKTDTYLNDSNETGEDWKFTPSPSDQWLRSAKGRLYRVSVLSKGTNWTKVRFLNTGNVRTVMNFQGKLIQQ